MTESEVEAAALDWLSDLGYEVAYGPDISPGGRAPERDDYRDVVLVRRLRESLLRMNADLQAEAIEEAVRKVLLTESPSLVENNRRFHRLLTDGVDVECRDKDGSLHHEKVWLVDTHEPENNDWLAVNQFTVVEGRNERRPDIVLFVNGLPLGLIELKNPADEKATLLTAFRQLQTYKAEMPGLFRFNEVLTVADGHQARAGTLTAEWEWFLPWRTIEGTELYREPGNEKQTEGELRPGLSPASPTDHGRCIGPDRPRNGVVGRARAPCGFWDPRAVARRTAFTEPFSTRTVRSGSSSRVRVVKVLRQSA